MISHINFILKNIVIRVRVYILIRSHTLCFTKELT